MRTRFWVGGFCFGIGFAEIAFCYDKNLILILMGCVIVLVGLMWTVRGFESESDPK